MKKAAFIALCATLACVVAASFKPLYVWASDTVTRKQDELNRRDMATLRWQLDPANRPSNATRHQ